MQENREDQPKSSDKVSVGSMDLLSLTLRSIDLRNSTKKEDFLGLEEENAVKRDDAARKTLRTLKKSKQEARNKTFGSTKQESKELRTINLDEIAWHDTADDCWVVVQDFVYDCTDLLKNHPGGEDVILEYAGRDATLAFIGTGHSRAARRSLESFLIGELPPEERIFRVPDGVKIAEF